VIVAAFDEEAVIGRKLDETLALDYPAELLQVIVAADGSSDSTAQIAATYASRGVVVLHRPERLGKLAAITRAMGHATGDVVVFSDANNHYDAAALRHLAAPFSDPGVGIVTGRKTIIGDDGLGYSEGLYWRYESLIRRWETRVGSSTGVNGEIIALRRALFVQPPHGIINDDAWMAHHVMRLGSRIVYNEAAISSEPVSATAADEVTRRSRMVAGQWQVLFRARTELPWRHPLVLWQVASHKLMRPLVPFAMLAAAVTGTLALFLPGDGSGPGGLFTLSPPWHVVLFALQAAFYLLAAVGSRLEGPIGKLAYVPRFLVDSNLAALRGLVGYLKGTQTVTWEKAARRDEPTGSPT